MQEEDAQRKALLKALEQSSIKLRSRKIQQERLAFLKYDVR
jgi:hypothetical protein